MKRPAIAVSVVGLVFGVAILAKTQTQSVEQELLKLEQDWTNANLKGDVVFLDRFVIDDYTWIDNGGAVWTKDQTLAAMKSGELVLSSLFTDDMKVRNYGDAAVVAGRNMVKGTLKGMNISGQERFTDTWIKRDGRWQCVATHSSAVPQK